MSPEQVRDFDARFDGAWARVRESAMLALRNACRQSGEAPQRFVLLLEGAGASVLPLQLARFVFAEVGGYVTECLASEPDPGCVWVVGLFDDGITTSARPIAAEVRS